MTVLDQLYAPLAPHLLFGMPVGMEWLVIAFIALILFGKRLPGVARSMGQGINEFKRGLKDGESEASEEDDDVPAQRELPEQKEKKS